MASWYSKLLTTTTSQISNLQSRLLQSENDGDTEDDTHGKGGGGASHRNSNSNSNKVDKANL
ncbi:unnamed protein product [Parascedosporium putredinis]|uniref:Uncharacterized protein n=1 Tax=Parascedosporium putredinis TaxID=1442378 RepID=A0A9P1MD73_9PEZI|nr:unnamed protein product [Parascedosporium putredinis]CAI7999057.1 unnamed protein product [Parascedosporium putredinis]